MKKSVFKYFVVLFIGILGLVSCQKEVSLETKGIERGQGVVQDFNFEPNVRVALLDKRALETLRAQDPEKAPDFNFGAMDTRYVTLDDVIYMVHWDDDQDFKNIKRGEKVNFRASEYIARIEKTGQNYKVIFLHEM